MHHVTLDRAGTHDGHFDHQIIKALWTEPRQHRHLCPRLDLKNADGVGFTDHPIYRLIFCRHGGHGQRAVTVLSYKVETFMDST